MSLIQQIRDDATLEDQELPPCVGEKFRDILAERAIATLADNVDEAQ